MKPYDRVLRLAAAIGAAVGLVLAARGYGEEVAPPAIAYRSLPTTIYVIGPGTAYSANMHSNADFVRAVGSLRVDTAIARTIHADAYAKELNNAKLEVQVYFERKLMNRAYRAMLNPKRPPPSSPGAALFEKLSKGNFCKEMNWLLLALFQKRMYDDAAFTEAVSQDAVSDLDVAMLERLWFTDHPEHGVRFRANSIPLNDDWPALLQTPAFEQERRNFVKARDEALEQTKKNGSVDAAGNENLQRAQEELDRKFHDEYGSKLGKPGEARANDYVVASGFLRSLRFQVCRFVRSGFQQGDYHFRGDHLGELVDFMGSRGLYFDKPQPGDEGAYQAIFVKMQGMYEGMVGPAEGGRRGE
jgi:hypothetical protein